MKILLINNQHHRMGGAHAVYLSTAELLKKHGHGVFFFALKDEKMLSDEYANYFPKAIDYRRLSTLSKIKSVRSFIYNKEAYTKLNEYIKFIKPDIAHIHLFMGGLTVSILDAFKENNIPIVHTVHDYRLICPAYLFFNGENEICEKCRNNMYYQCIVNKCSENSLSQSTILALDAYVRKWVKNPYKYIDSLIFVSNFALRKHLEFGLSQKIDSNVLYNFIPELSECKPNNKKGKYYLYFGRLSREKGIMTLLEAAKKTNINLKILGTGPLQQIITSQKSNNIEILGYKKGNELIEIIKNASFIIVPSEWYENNPMSVIESYAYGKPVIGADIGGIPEIVEHNKTGYLFESGNIDALAEQIEIADNLSDKEYEVMSKNARQFADIHFNPENYIIELIKIYNKIIYG